MPRLHGYRERLYANFYDAVSVLEMDEEHNRLFNNRNIGQKMLTNMMVGGRIHGDLTFVLVNAYVRTNLGLARPTLHEDKRKEVRDLFVDGNDGDAIGTLMRECQWERTPLVKSLEEWAHAAVVTIVIGDKPMFVMNAYDLMDGPALGPSRRPDGPIQVMKEQGDDWSPKHIPWRKELARPLIVPVRQCFSVLIEPEAETTRELKRRASEAGVLPCPLAWVHLEGLQTRDVG